MVVPAQVAPSLRIALQPMFLMPMPALTAARGPVEPAGLAQITDLVRVIRVLRVVASVLFAAARAVAVLPILVAMDIQPEQLQLFLAVPAAAGPAIQPEGPALSV